MSIARSFTSLFARSPSRGLTLALFGSLAATSSGDAHAHIKLLQPASWAVEDDLGNPQKDGPCGGDGVEETGDVTTFRAGEEITVEWQETVGHPGHFRIAVATDRDDLFDPEVETTNGDGVSGNHGDGQGKDAGEGAQSAQKYRKLAALRHPDVSSMGSNDE